MMAVHKYRSLWPKRKTMKDRAVEFFLENHKLVLFSVMSIVFLVVLAVLQSQAQADFLMKYGSGY